jgi:hypothetical protein
MQSICKHLLGIKNHIPFFKYCKIYPKVEFMHLESMEDHIRLNDPEKYKSKLLEYLEKDERKED